MEIIRKKIYLEDSRCRTNSNLPFIPYNVSVEGQDWTAITQSTINKGSWGNFAADLSGETIQMSYKDFDGASIVDTTSTWVGKSNVIRTLELLKRYYDILKILRNGEYIEGKQNAMCDTASTWDGKTYVKVAVINGTAEKTMRDYIPYNRVWFDKNGNEFIKKYGEASASRKVNLISPTEYEEYQKLGGMGLVRYVDELINSSITWSNKYTKPTIDMDIFLSQDMADVGVLTTYETLTLQINSIGAALFDSTTFSVPMVQAIASSSTWTDFSSITAESRLQELQLEYNMSDDETLSGVFEPYCGDTYFTKAKYSGGKWKLNNPTVQTGLTCGDGKYIGDLGEKEYQTFSTPSALLSALSTAPTVKDYWFKIKYKDSLGIPYKVNVPFNSMLVESGTTGGTYVGDYITEIKDEGSAITFTYVMGGRFIERGKNITPIVKTGVVYTEKYPYKKGISATTVLDGYNATIYYNKIDYDANKQTIYNGDLNLYRQAIISNIIGYNVYDFLSDSGETINAPCFSQEYLFGMPFPITSEVDVEVDRGSSTAFEKHFKIAECNSFEDLENYGNNFFNI